MSGLASSDDLNPPQLIRSISSIAGDPDLTQDPSVTTRKFPYASRLYSTGGATLVVRMVGDGGTSTTLVMAANTGRDGQFTKIVSSGSSITGGNIEISWR